MPLVLDQQVETKLPIDVSGITPDRLVGQSISEISKHQILVGRDRIELGEVFNVTGDLAEQSIVFQGNLQPVHWIGAEMKDGQIQIASDCGRHVGSQMKGGKIVTLGDVSDFCGMEMTDGRIEVGGNAGDHLGGHFPGSKFGMNRGEILVQGNVGKGVGQAMRRGTIIVGGSADELAGWNMLAGTLVIFGGCGRFPGAGMKRGTIVSLATKEPEFLPTFRRGISGSAPVLVMLAVWLEKNFPNLSAHELREPFQLFHGDALHGSRGEIFVRQ